MKTLKITLNNGNYAFIDGKGWTQGMIERLSSNNCPEHDCKDCPIFINSGHPSWREYNCCDKGWFIDDVINVEEVDEDEVKPIERPLPKTPSDYEEYLKKSLVEQQDEVKRLQLVLAKTYLASQENDQIVEKLRKNSIDTVERYETLVQELNDEIEVLEDAVTSNESQIKDLNFDLDKVHQVHKELWDNYQSVCERVADCSCNANDIEIEFLRSIIKKLVKE
jgi:hypothetical protein